MYSNSVFGRWQTDEVWERWCSYRTYEQLKRWNLKRFEIHCGQRHVRTYNWKHWQYQVKKVSVLNDTKNLYLISMVWQLCAGRWILTNWYKNSMKITHKFNNKTKQINEFKWLRQWTQWINRRHFSDEWIIFALINTLCCCSHLLTDNVTFSVFLNFIPLDHWLLVNGFSLFLMNSIDLWFEKICTSTGNEINILGCLFSSSLSVCI